MEEVCERLVVWGGVGHQDRILGGKLAGIEVGMGGREEYLAGEVTAWFVEGRVNLEVHVHKLGYLSFLIAFF